jgi:hypothetical protein
MSYSVHGVWSMRILFLSSMSGVLFYSSIYGLCNFLSISVQYVIFCFWLVQFAILYSSMCAKSESIFCLCNKSFLYIHLCARGLSDSVPCVCNKSYFIHVRFYLCVCNKKYLIIMCGVSGSIHCVCSLLYSVNPNKIWQILHILYMEYSIFYPFVYSISESVQLYVRYACEYVKFCSIYICSGHNALCSRHKCNVPVSERFISKE